MSNIINKHTQETKNLAVSMYKSGISIMKIAEELKCGKSSVFRWIKTISRRKNNQENIDKARKMYLSGMSCPDIAPHFNVTRGCIEKWCVDIIRTKSEALRGRNNGSWRGGVTSEKKLFRGSALYKEWRTAVYSRDNYTCQKCGSKKSGTLEAHHIKPFSLFPKLRLEINNGLTLCRECHAKTDDYMKPLHVIRKMYAMQ